MTDLTDALQEAREEYGPDHPISQALFKARLAEVLTEETLHPQPGLYWISVATEDEFKGCCMVRAHGPMEARLSMSPAPEGECQIWGPLPEPDDPIPEQALGVWVTDKDKAERLADGDLSIFEETE